MPKNKGLFLGLISIVIVLFGIIYGFIIMGSPKEQRSLRLDQKRIEDLQNIQYQVINFWQQKEKLPISIDELKSPLTGVSIPVDPEFQKGLYYEYKVLENLSAKSGKKFQLCATFSLPMPDGWIEGGTDYKVMPARDVAVSSMPYPGGANESWDHEAGRTCFERTIDPDLYPPFPKNK